MIYKLGPVYFSLNGNSEIVNDLKKEFRPLEYHRVPEKVDIEFIYENKIRMPNKFDQIDGLFVGKEELFITIGNLNYLIIFEDGLPQKILFNYNGIKNNSIKGRIKKIKNWNYLSPSENGARIFIYGIFDYVTALHLMSKGASYIHASSVCKENRGIGIVAWGGVGKTTLMLKLILDYNWKYLSDDLGIVDKNGILWRSPKKMQIYAYNLEGQDKIKRSLLGGRGAIDILSWNLHLHLRGVNRVRRRVSAEELFSTNQVEERVKLNKIIFIKRVSANKFTTQKLTTKEIAYKSAVILLKELEPLFEYNIALSTIGRTRFFPSTNQFLDRSISNLETSYKGVESLEVQIPLHANPTDLVSFINDLL